MLDGLMLIDAHLHPARLPTLKPAWLDWARQYGQPGWEQAYDASGSVIPQAFDDLLEAEGVDHALLLCEYSPKVTGVQPAEELLPIIKHNPARFAFLANRHPPPPPPGGRRATPPARARRRGLEGAPGPRRFQRRRPDALPPS